MSVLLQRGRESFHLKKGEETLFAHSHKGFMVLDFTRDKVYLSVIEPKDEYSATETSFEFGEMGGELVGFSMVLERKERD